MGTSTDIVSLRINHSRAEHAASSKQFHLAVMHYRTCLEAAELREDCQAAQFFSLQLAICYENMGFIDKALNFRALSCAKDILLE